MCQVRLFSLLALVLLWCCACSIRIPTEWVTGDHSGVYDTHTTVVFAESKNGALQLLIPEYSLKEEYKLDTAPYCSTRYLKHASVSVCIHVWPTQFKNLCGPFVIQYFVQSNGHVKVLQYPSKRVKPYGYLAPNTSEPVPLIDPDTGLQFASVTCDVMEVNKLVRKVLVNALVIDWEELE